ncbi:hypothetical protein [Croceiramulus getboli]|nr:hypothetical protein P8624_05520 [Flavobacteriaceae bacterium YJPT1-3]
MYEVLQFVHSYWAYLVVLVLTITTINSIGGLLADRPYGARDMRLALFTLITTHIQLLIGLVLYFVSPLGLKAINTYGMGEVMKNADLRLYVVEHPTVMILTVILVTVGYSKHKKKLLSKPKFKMLTIFYALGLVLMLSRIPWTAWF